MLASTYQQTFPGRINADFIGIASRYSQEKQRRKTEEARKKSLESNYLYSYKKDWKLQRSIHSKSAELSRLQSSRLRKLEAIKSKEELKEIRQYQLEQLRAKNHKARSQNRKRLEVARSRLLTMNQQGWSQLKANHDQETQSLKKKIQNKLQEKAKQCQLIRKKELNGLKRIDNFHKRKNSQNLETYLQRIRQQSRMRKEEEAKARRLKKEIDKINKSVSLKTNYLNCIDQQICKYKTDIIKFNRARTKQHQANQKSHNQKQLESNLASMYQDNQKSIFQTLDI